ncbi:MAG: c-type cytochrome biosis protein [Cyanobacteria bacterium RYN_339]|nr:c-type cytochrome biosis protein [Cyanobacteria bacterium RYN_339]
MTTKQPFHRKALIALSSMKLAIGLLLLVAAASSIGTVFPQDEGIKSIEGAKFAPWLKQLLIAIQAYDAYHAPWFQGLLAVLFLNLACCTYLRFPATWRRLRLAEPAAPPVASLPVAVPVAGPEIAALLRRKGYRVRPRADGGLFAEKGKPARWAPTLIHLSLFVVIGGAVWGGLASWRGSAPLIPGDTAPAAQIFKQADQHGWLARPPAPFDVHLDGFRMIFRPDGQVKQYYSDLTVTPHDGRAPVHKTIWVNEPLVFDGVYFYQSFWGVAAADVTIDGKAQQIPLMQAPVGYVSKPLPLPGPPVVLFVKAPEQPAVLIETKGFNIVGQLAPGLGGPLHGTAFRLEGYHFYSGFQVKQDPGIPAVYLGCALLLLGLGLVPFSHRELWVRQHDGRWWLAGRASKGKVAFGREVAALAAQVPPTMEEIAS